MVFVENIVLFLDCSPGTNITTQFCRIKDAAVRGGPPSIIFERLKLPQQIIYRRKGNLSKSIIGSVGFDLVTISG